MTIPRQHHTQMHHMSSPTRALNQNAPILETTQAALLLWKNQGREGSTVYFSDALIIRSPFIPLILCIALAKGGIPVTRCESCCNVSQLITVNGWETTMSANESMLDCETVSTDAVRW